MGTIFVTAILSCPFWNRVARQWNKKVRLHRRRRLLGRGPARAHHPRDRNDLSAAARLCVLAGIGVGAAHVLPWSILPDAVEWDEWKTGERHEGTFYSLVTLAQKVASSVAIPLALLLLGAFGLRRAAACPARPPRSRDPDHHGPHPAALLCLGILCAVFYPIGREEFAKITAELAARRTRTGEKP